MTSSDTLMRPQSAEGRSIRLGSRTYPVVLPTVGDARLHTATVIMTLHVLGQVSLDFAVSVPQIAVAIGTCVVLELAVTAVRTARLVWPASAMLTGSGVGLILRVNGTEAGDHWSWHGWHLFALVSAFSLATKYLVRSHGSHVFNPSNAGLVGAFLLLGRSRVEPLDLWWGPLEEGMIAAYAVILIGGFAIINRLGLLPMAASFWLALLSGLAVLTVTGHCITSPWSIGPICDWHFWWVFATSPEVLVFLFFMLPDPKTVPSGGGNRIAFGIAVGAVAAVLIAPARTEYAAKVGLLGALTVVSAARAAIRWAAERRSVVDRFHSARGDGSRAADRWAVAVGMAVPIMVAVALLGLVQLGARARDPHLPEVDAAGVPDIAAIADRIVVPSLPPISFDPEVEALGADLVTSWKGREVAAALLFDLAAEAEILEHRDGDLLPAVASGDRLAELRRALGESNAHGLVIPTYRFDDLRLVVGRRGGQGGALLGVLGRGRVRSTTYDSAGEVVAVDENPVEVTFVLIPSGGERWLILDSVE